MKDITQMDPNKISNNGFYIDVSRSKVIHLSDSEILAARKYFQMPEIASERRISKYSITTSNKYHKGKMSKKNGKQGIIKIIVVGGVTISILVLGTRFLSNAEKGDYVGLDQYVLPIQINVEEETKGESFESIQKEVPIVSSSSSFTPEEFQRREWVKKYCSIYQVDFEKTYDKLVQLTDNFTSELYLNGSIPNVTCKKENVCCNNEEALILYFVRCVKQVPERLGIDSDGLYIQTDYQPEGSYADQIGYYGNLLGVDPALVYSIVQAETSWNSDNFLNINNPAGLKNGDGTWWVFSTKEEGFIELCLEILKYNRLGAYTIEEIGNIHAPVEDGNENWIPNVRFTYEEVSQTLFSIIKVSEDEKVR